jgi:hypothetical protein
MDRLTDDERRLLELLAGSANGSTLLIASGFTLDMMGGLARCGFVTARAERPFAGGKPMEIKRLQITEAGRRALAGQQQQPCGAGA